MKLYIPIACLAWWWISQIVYGQPSLHPYVVAYHDTYHNLPQNTVLDIAMKKDHFMTVATTNGIVNFDGEKFYDFIDNKAYKNTIYRRVVWHPHQDTLYGYALDGSYKRLYPTFEEKQVLYSVFFGDSLLTYITKYGDIIQSNYELTEQQKMLTTSVHNAMAFFETARAYYVVDARKIYKINKITGKETILQEGSFSVKKIKRNPFTGEIYFLSQDKLYVLSNNERNLQQVDLQRDQTVIVEDIDFISETRTVVVSSHGIIYFEDEAVHHFYYDGHVPIPPLYCVYYYPAEQCLFLGTETRGLMKISRQRTYSFLHNQEFSTQSFVSITQCGEDMFSAYGSGHIMRFTDSAIVEEYLFIPVAIASLSCINHQFYIGTWGEGLLIYEGKECIRQIGEPTLPSGSVRATYQDRNNSIWIATDKGVMCESPQKKLNKIPGPQQSIGIIYELKNGNICLGGEEGFFIVQNDKLLKHIGQNEGLICREVRAFYEDQNAILWIGTYNGGLYRYDPQTNELRSINLLPRCLLNDNIFTIVKGRNDLLYMSSNKGIWAVSEKKLNDFSNGTLPYLIPFNINKKTGMQNIELSGGFQNNYLQRSNEAIYFPSLHGIVRMEQTIAPFRELHPIFTSLFINGKKMPLSTIEFPADTRTISFSFCAFSCLEQYNVFYQYRLVGKSKTTDWSMPRKENSISMSLLSEGDYTILIRAIDGFNDKFPQESAFNFIILPRFYETIWFKSTFGIIAFLLTAYILQKYFRRVRIQYLQQHEIEQTVSELKIQNLQLQMNPHFIFNALNNIIYLLNIEKLKEAEQMLLDFSLLMRRYLEKSSHSFLTISEELDIIKLYLDVQKQRFQNQFSYSIVCPDSLLEQVIPSMLVQPFVENAIVHGFSHSQEQGHLLITIEEINGGIQVRITDNGIGRKQAALINQSKRPHTSYGIQLVQQKIDVVFQKYNIKIDFMIEDLQQGTSVTVKIRKK